MISFVSDSSDTVGLGQSVQTDWTPPTQDERGQTPSGEHALLKHIKKLEIDYLEVGVYNNAAPFDSNSFKNLKYAL